MPAGLCTAVSDGGKKTTEKDVRANNGEAGVTTGLYLKVMHLLGAQESYIVHTYVPTLCCCEFMFLHVQVVSTAEHHLSHVYSHHCLRLTKDWLSEDVF